MKSYISSDLNKLIDELAANIKRDSGDNIFSAPINRIIIPSLVNKNWLLMQISQRNKIAVKLEFDTLEWSPYRLAKEINVKNISENLTSRDLSFEVLKILADNTFLEKPDIKSIKEYINGRNNCDKHSPISCIKKYELASKFSSLIIKYVENMPEIIESWNTGKKVYNTPEEEIQFLIYQELMKDNKKKGIPIEGFNTNLAEKQENIKIHIFGYPYIHMATLETLKKIGDFIEINLYIQTIGENSENNSTISEWLKVQKEFQNNIRNIRIEEKYLTENTTKYKNKSTILDILKSNNIPSSKKTQDKSFQIAACPGSYREIETVWNSIIYNLQKDPDLKLSDIGILLCNTEKYYPAIVSVFERSKDKLPYNTTCVLPKQASSYINGLFILFELIESNFSISQLESLLLNSCFLAKFNLQKKDIENWMENAEKLGMWEFFNKIQKNRYYESDIYTDTHTIKQNLIRLRLSKIMDSQNDENWNNFIPFKPFNNENIDKIGLIIEQLYYKCQNIKEKQFTKTEDTINSIKDFINTFLSLDNGNKQELNASYFVSRLINEFLFECNSRNYTPNIYDLPNYLKINLSNTQFSRGIPFTNGVIIGHIKNIKMPDFKILYLVGMNEDDFPSKTSFDSLDLTKNNPNRITDKQIDEYTFYKAICSAKEKLYITYNAKDRVKDIKLYPSSCVSNCISYLNKNILKDEAYKVTEIPLLGRNPDYYSNNKNNAAYTDLLENYYENDYILAKIENGCDKPEDTIFNTDKSKDKLNEIIEPIEIDINHIIDFLKNPIEYTLSTRLHLSDYGEADKSEIKQAPLTTKHHNKIIRESIKKAYSKENNNFKEEFKEHYKKLLQKGEAPESVFYQIEEAAKTSEIEKIETKLSHYKATVDLPVKLQLNAVLNNKSYLVNISGLIPLLSITDSECVFISLEEVKDRFNLKVKLYIQFVLYSQEQDDNITYSVTDIAGNRFIINNTGKEETKKWLSDIVSAMLDSNNLYDNLPADRVFMPSEAEEIEKIQNAAKDSDLNEIYYNNLNQTITDDMISDYPKHKYWHYILTNFPDITKVPEDAAEKIMKRLMPIKENITN